jgi:uroporphyrin-III C-methyltransferase / precorrin-2 dehydrogenase / sirohydrochlorin ferrochelatase
MHQLPIFLNLTDQPVLIVGNGEAAEAKARLVIRAGGRIVGSLADGPRLAFVALEEEDEAAAIAVELRASGLLVNVVDRPALCDFTTPAIIDRAPMTIAIGTGGASAGLAKALRQRLETLIPARLGALAAGLSSARTALRQRWPDKDDRRRAIDTALEPGAPLDPFGAGGEGGEAAIAAWLAASDGRTGGTLRVETITLTSADPDDLTIKQARWLASADLVVHGADVPDAILSRARADAARVEGDAVPEGAQGLVVMIDRAGG